MNKTCSMCATQIPIIASVCPNCTRNITFTVGGSGDDSTLGILIAVVCLIGMFIFNTVKG